ncbi:MAG: zinc ABC transporter substrate-binding protein [Chloroflexi bacterium]|nr:zinc ABC transporter substrate-binding protein [Chloroflexota bacterium]
MSVSSGGWSLKNGAAVFFFIAVISSLALPGCQPDRQPPAGGVSVVASFYPLYEAARQVAGERASVRSLVPPGTESHDFEPTPRDTAALFNARMVVYNGAGFEPWLDRLLPELKEKGIVLVEASKSIDLLQMEDEDDPSRKVPDPHFWLDPVLMQQVVTAVRNGYIQVDPANRAFYEASAAAYNARLQALHQKYQQGLQGYARRTIVTSHAAFSYLARRYNLEMVSIAGLSPMAEPSPQQMAAVVRLVRERGIRYIFFETLVDPRLAETIARETGAGTLVFNPLEGLTEDEVRAGKDYISVMEENLVNLKKAFEAGR